MRLRAAVLLPIISTDLEDGPIKIMPLSSTLFMKAEFSERKPYPG